MIMTTTELEQVIRTSICNTFKREYTGKIKIKKLDPVGYSVSLYPQGEYIPLVFDAELEDDLFIKYLIEDIRNRKFHLQWYGTLNKIESYDK